MNNKYTFSPDAYFEKVGKTFSSPYEKAQSKEDAERIAEDVRRKLSSLLSPDLIPLKKVDLVSTTLFSRREKAYDIEKRSVEICDGLNMMYYLLTPHEAAGDGIVCLCGHGYGARQIVRLSSKDRFRRVNFFDDYQKNFAHALACEGHTVIVPEFIGFGEARLKKDRNIPFYGNSCETISAYSQLFCFSTAALRIYQTRCCVDILSGLLTSDSIGVMGISGGGLVALYASCLDDRIKKTCVCGYINTFDTSILARWHCPDNYIPGLRQIGDMYDFAASLAPGKLMMQYGTADKLFTVTGSDKAAAEIKKIYRLYGAEESFVPVRFSGKHEVSLPEALEFFRV